MKHRGNMAITMPSRAIENMEVDVCTRIRWSGHPYVEPLSPDLNVQVSHNCRAAPAERQSAVVDAGKRAPDEPTVYWSKVVSGSQSNALRTRYCRPRALPLDGSAGQSGRGCHECEGRGALGPEAKLRVGTSLVVDHNFPD